MADEIFDEFHVETTKSAKKRPIPAKPRKALMPVEVATPNVQLELPLPAVEAPTVTMTIEPAYRLALESLKFGDAGKRLLLIVVGVGGTGAYVIRDLSRMISFLNGEKGHHHQMLIIDGDEVEKKNWRQNFVLPDLGKNKAEVIAERYSNPFLHPVTIDHVSSYVESAEALSKIIHSYLLRDSQLLPVLIGCVDSNKVRVEVFHRLYKKYFGDWPMFWIDSGNEEVSGQVSVAFREKTIHTPGAWIGKLKGYAGLFALPTVFDIYPSALNYTDKLPSELSCEDRAESAPQDILANVTAASLVLSSIRAIMNNDIRHHLVTFDVDTCKYNTQLNTKTLLAPFN